MPKLVQINVSQNWGSTGKIAEQLGVLAQKSGWDVYMVHGARYVSNSQLTSLQATTYHGELGHWVYSHLFDAQGLWAKGSTTKLCKKLTEIKPDLIHLHILHGYYLNYKILFDYIKAENIPVVWTIHDCWPFTGHCVHFQKYSCLKWMEECSQCPAIHEFPKSFFWDGSSRNFNLKKHSFVGLPKAVMVPVSNWLGGLVKKTFLNCYPCNVIHNGIDINTFSYTVSDIRVKLGITQRYMLLAVAQEFGKRKGLDDYNKLSNILGCEYKIVLVGLSEEEKKNVDDNILALGLTNNVQELIDIYSAADVLMSLSYEETFGLTIVEGMSCGTPTVIYDNTGQSEIVTDETGRKVQTGDIEAVKNAIEEICQKGKEYYSKACRNRVEEYFDKEKLFKKYLELYDDILESK